MQARNIKRGDKELESSERQENAICIKKYAADISSTLCADDSKKAEATQDLIVAFLTSLSEAERLQIGNVFENYPAFFWKSTEYQSTLPDIFRELITDQNIERIKEWTQMLKGGIDHLAIFDLKQQQTILKILDRMKQQDKALDARAAKPTSVIGILNKQGYLAANEPYFDSDLQSALDGYKGTHGSVTVISDISATDQIDLERLKPHIEAAKAAASKDAKPQEIYLVTNNGTYHFVCVKIKIQPTGEVDIVLQDSKPGEKVSADHQAKNDFIITVIKELSGTDSKAVVSYTGEQGDNANCPFYSVREVVRRCSALPDFKVTKADDLREAAAGDCIVDLQLAMTRKVARKKGLSEGVVAGFEVDDLGILHTKDPTKEYESHRAFRLKESGKPQKKRAAAKAKQEAHESEKQKIIDEVKKAEMVADIAEVEAAKMMADAALKEEADAKKTPQEKIVEKLLSVTDELTQVVDMHPTLSAEEKMNIKKLKGEIYETVSLIISNEVSLADHKKHLAKLKEHITELSHLNPDGLKLFVNFIGVVTIIPALISKRVTGRWGIFSKNIDPSVGLEGIFKELDKLEKAIPSQSLGRS